MSDVDIPLTQDEQADFERLELIVSEGVDRMEAAGKALLEIRDRKLYRGQFRTFATYVETKWAFGVRRAYQLIEAEKVIENLRTNGSQILPVNERQVRELAKIEPEDQPRVWNTAIETGNTSAAGIAEIVEVLSPSPNSEPKKERPKTTVVIDVASTPDTTMHGRFQALKAAWNLTDELFRVSFLNLLFGERPRRDVSSAIRRAAKKGDL